jgi:hypothetical protein
VPPAGLWPVIAATNGIGLLEIFAINPQNALKKISTSSLERVNNVLTSKPAVNIPSIPLSINAFAPCSVFSSIAL